MGAGLDGVAAPSTVDAVAAGGATERAARGGRTGGHAADRGGLGAADRGAGVRAAVRAIAALGAGGAAVAATRRAVRVGDAFGRGSRLAQLAAIAAMPDEALFGRRAVVEHGTGAAGAVEAEPGGTAVGVLDAADAGAVARCRAALRPQGLDELRRAPAGGDGRRSFGLKAVLEGERRRGGRLRRQHLDVAAARQRRQGKE